MELVESLSPAPDEVGAIWSVPLEYCLTAQWKEEYGVPSEKGGPDWPYDDEYYVSYFAFADDVPSRLFTGPQNYSNTNWLKTSGYRMNRFRTTHTPLVRNPD